MQNGFGVFVSTKTIKPKTPNPAVVLHLSAGDWREGVQYVHLCLCLWGA
jgi:hypothetical protein